MVKKISKFLEKLYQEWDISGGTTGLEPTHHYL